jgi:uncharacterized lipoprotein YmbA
LILLAPLAAGACSSPVPNYYSIVTRRGPTLLAGPKVVLVKDIGPASYLDRREIVRSSEGYHLDVVANDWWGKPLGAMLGRVLMLELSQRLVGSSVYGESGAINTDPSALVGVNIQRLDADKAGSPSTCRGAPRDAISPFPSRHRRRTFLARWRRSATRWAARRNAPTHDAHHIVSVFSQ